MLDAMTDLATMIVDLVRSGQVKEEDATIAFSLAKFYQRHGTLTKPMELTAYSVLSGYDTYDLSTIERPVDDDSDTVEVLESKTPGAAEPLKLKRKSAVRFDVEGNWIIGTTPFDLKDLCKSIPGRKWSPPEHPKKWCWPRGPVAAMALRDAFAAYEPDWDPLFEALLGELDDAKAHKISTDHPDIDSVTTVAWMHQRQAYQFIKSLRGAALWMDMGTGKSLPAVARALDIGGHILIVCPDKVVGVWPREFRRHGARPVHIENGLRPKKRGYGHKKLTVKERVEAFNELRECTCGKPHVYVTNYDTIVHQPLQSWLVNREWDLFIMDESQKIKAPQGIQSKIAAKIGAKSAWRLQLTGTPLPQSPLDVFAQYRALDPGIFGNAFTTFRNRYALMGGYEDREFIDMNPATVDELNAKMFQFAFRVESDDVLDLPKIMEDQFLSCSMEGAQAKAYKDMDDEMTAEFPGTTVAEMVERVLTGETIAPNAMVKLLRLRQITGGALRDDESGKALMVGDAKGKLLAEWMEDFPKDEPLVVFAEFTHDLAVIRAVAEKQGRTHGEVSGSRNDLTIDSEFPEHLDVLAVQIASGGSGVDLTRACYGAYYSTGYSNGNYRQSRARLHRPGQTRSVRFTHLLVEGTVDEIVFQTLEGKQELVDRVMGNGR